MGGCEVNSMRVLRRPHEKMVRCVGGPIAQWSRATDCLSEGRQFKSGSARQHALLCIFPRLVSIRAFALRANARLFVLFTRHPFMLAAFASIARQFNLGHTVTVYQHRGITSSILLEGIDNDCT